MDAIKYRAKPPTRGQHPDHVDTISDRYREN